MEYHSTSAARVHKHIRLLSAAGVDMANSFAQMGLPTLIIDRPHFRVPSIKTYSALHAIGLKEGIADLGFLAALSQTFETFEEPYRSRFEECVNVYQALRLYISLIPRINPTRHGRVVVGAASASFILDAHTDDRSSVWLNYSDWGNVMNVAALIKHAVGNSFSFNAIELMSDWPVPGSFSRKFDCLLLRGRPAVRLTFQKELLFKPYPAPGKKEGRRMPPGHSYLEPSFPEIVEETLKTFVPEFNIGIEDAAEIFATTPRTLQRHLASHGTSFSEILLHTKMSTASELLRDNSIAIADIATTVGYAEQASFTRAFRAVIGMTPGLYRRNTAGE